MFHNSGVCECEIVRVITYLLSDGAKKVYKAYTANDMSAGAHVYHRTWAVVFNILIQSFLAKNVLHEAYDLVTRGSQGPVENKLYSRTSFLKAPSRRRHISKAMEEGSYCDRGLKP